jgi:hypothetical protein
MADDEEDFAAMLAASEAGAKRSRRPKVGDLVQGKIISLGKGDLETGGLAFITPSTVTGQEQEKEGVALTFADVIKSERPALKVVTLAETLGAVNRAGLADPYRHMYEHYRDTGLFPDAVLRQVGKAAGTRYLAQLKLDERLRPVNQGVDEWKSGHTTPTRATARSPGRECRSCASRSIRRGMRR